MDCGIWGNNVSCGGPFIFKDNNRQKVLDKLVEYRKSLPESRRKEIWELSNNKTRLYYKNKEGSDINDKILKIMEFNGQTFKAASEQTLLETVYLYINSLSKDEKKKCQFEKISYYKEGEPKGSIMYGRY